MGAAARYHSPEGGRGGDPACLLLCLGLEVEGAFLLGAAFSGAVRKGHQRDRETVTPQGRSSRGQRVHPAPPSGRAAHWAGHAGSGLLWETSSHPVCSSQTGQAATPATPPQGAPNPHPRELGEETECLSLPEVAESGPVPSEGDLA